MTASRKARARAALRYWRRYTQNGCACCNPRIKMPPSVLIAEAHRFNPHVFRLESRREWKRDR